LSTSHLPVCTHNPICLPFADMAVPFPMVDPDDPRFKGRTWDMVEQALEERADYLVSTAGYDMDLEEARSKSMGNPMRPQRPPFPWEEEIAAFVKPATCTLKTWRHKCLAYSIGQQTATLTFTKGEQRNTFDPAMLDALQDAIMDLQEQKDVRVVFLKAEGKLFSGGFDPKYLASESKMTEAEIIKVYTQLARIFHFFQRLPQLTVALVQGSAMGAALGLIAVCDLVVAVKAAFFAVSEVKIGQVPTTSVPYIMKRMEKSGQSRQLLIAGQSLPAHQAKDYGLVDEVVEDEAALAEETKTLCSKFTLCAPGAVAVTKLAVIHTMGQPASSFMLNHCADVLAEAKRSTEAKQGIEAIQAKRKPIWAANVMSA